MSPTRGAQRIAVAVRQLNELRERWLNPPDLVVRVPEVVPGYPDRILPKDEECAKELKKRTLTKLHNQRPAWLDNVHMELDAAVAAYGWPAGLSDDEILEPLFELNQQRARVTQASPLRSLPPSPEIELGRGGFASARRRGSRAQIPTVSWTSRRVC